MKKVIITLGLTMMSVLPARADFFDDLRKLQDQLNKLKGPEYVCTAGAFGKNFQVIGKDKDQAAYEVQQQCLRAGVSWVFCSPKCRTR